MLARLALTAVLLALSGTATADTLLIDGVEQARLSEDARPTRGMSMERVESRFGAPSNQRAAIGDPPISRWEYPGFVVYFEYKYVIHAVGKSG